MNDKRPPRRRTHTRWLMIGAVLGLAVIISGVYALEAAQPQVDAPGLDIPDVPPLALQSTRSCTPAEADAVRAEVVAAFDPGGRISSTQVYACPRAYDELEVVFVGEAIGEVLERRGGAWLQVNDDAYALEVGPVVGHRQLRGFNTGLSVWLPDGLHEQIETVGRPEVRGDVIAVHGTLLRADPDDGGGVTVRAERLEVLAPGITVEPPLHVLDVFVAVVLGVLAIASAIWARRVRTR
jgi:hypothetical protein